MARAFERAGVEGACDLRACVRPVRASRRAAHLAVRAPFRHGQRRNQRRNGRADDHDRALRTLPSRGGTPSGARRPAQGRQHRSPQHSTGRRVASSPPHGRTDAGARSARGRAQSTSVPLGSTRSGRRSPRTTLDGPRQRL